MSRDFAALGAELAPRVLDEMRQLVAISTPSGELDGTEQAIVLCQAFLDGWQTERLPCSTERCAPDLLLTLAGTGSRRLLLLGHLDTVVGHADHEGPRADGERLYGSGTADMKGGVAIALAVARECARSPADFAELSVLLVCDEEWRIAPFRHVDRFSGYDACLCFEAGEVSEDGQDGVIVRRKGAGTMRVLATGRAAHSGSAPQDGRNALLALAQAALTIAAVNDPHGEHQLTVVPTVVRSGEAFNVVPAAGELICDMRAKHTAAFALAVAAVPSEVGGARLEAVMERVWPAMDSEASAAPLLAAASQLLGRPIVPRARGGASDASHFAPAIPLTVDGLGPRGGGAHTPQEHVHVASLADRIAVALCIARAAIDLR
ncbi:MAG: M20/M25/M40 family metallo-hydrolase [Conexibacteraceae bacterium]|nr:M20/M25/M40 family metallo-hydrolase [Conexibacteraceae bacterium]